MAKRFAVAAEGLTDATKFALASTFSDKNILWWHRVENFWLLISNDEEIDADYIRDIIQDKMRSKKVVVVEILNLGATSWSFPKDNYKDDASWIEQHW